MNKCERLEAYFHALKVTLLKRVLVSADIDVGDVAPPKQYLTVVR